MRVLVTGATGFIGRSVVQALRSRGDDVVCSDCCEVRVLSPGIAFVQADLLRPDLHTFIVKSVERADAVLHIGAIMPRSEPFPDPAQYMLGNTVATVRLLQAASELGAKSFAYAASVGAIGRPGQTPITEEHPAEPAIPYHLSKLCGELACEQARRSDRLAVCSLRLTSPYGPAMATQSVLPRFVKQALASEDLAWFGSGERTQNFVHVSDVARAFMKAIETPNPGVYNVGGSEAISIKELARLVVSLTHGSSSRVCQADAADPQDDYRWDVSLDKARRGLGYLPEVSLDQGLRDYVATVRSNEPPRTWFSRV